MNIKEMRNKLGITQQQLADATGIPKTRIEKWEVGKGNPKVDDYVKLQKFFSKNTLHEEEIPYRNHDNQKGIPALPIKVQGGFNIHVDDPVFISQLERIYIPGIPFDGDDYLWAEVEGDSMEYVDPHTNKISGISDGTWCLFQKVPQEYWRTGLKKYYVHLVITDSLFTVKRILQDNSEEIVLHPDNEMYQQERIHLKDVKAIYLFKRKLDWNVPPPRKIDIKV